MVETPLTFDLPSLSTIEREAHTVSIRTRENFPHNDIAWANEKGWVNENKMLWWIETVWSGRAPDNPSSFLILDFFRAHLIDPVKLRIHIQFLVD